MLEQEVAQTVKHTSYLDSGRERFLAHVIEHAFKSGRRSAADFVRHFPPSVIMEGLQEQPELRADLLVSTVGVKHKIAAKKSWQSCAEDLQIALDEGETTADAIVGLFGPDDRVRYLDSQAIWSFVTEGDFWKTSPSRQQEYAAAKSHMAFMLARALEDELIDHTDIVDGITVEEIASRLPKSELGKIIRGALECGKRDAPFLESDLLASMPPEVLVNYVPLFQVWDAVIASRIAGAHGYSGADAAEPATKSDPQEQESALGAFSGIGSSRAPEPEERAVSTRALEAPQPDATASTSSRRGGAKEDPQQWSRELTDETDFVDAGELLDEEPSGAKPSAPPPPL